MRRCGDCMQFVQGVCVTDDNNVAAVKPETSLTTRDDCTIFYITTKCRAASCT